MHDVREDDHERIIKPEELRAALLQWHQHANTVSTIPLGDPVEIAELARGLVLRRGPIVDGLSSRTASWAGLAVYALDRYGLDYNTLLDRSNHSIAAAVAVLTGDNRLFYSDRQIELLTRLHLSSHFVQLVKLSEIVVRVRAVRRHAHETRGFLRRNKQDVADWLVAYRDQLFNLRKVFALKLVDRPLSDMSVLATKLGIGGQRFSRGRNEGGELL